MAEDLVAIKGNSRAARRRYDSAKQAARDAVASYLSDSSRKPYRGRVAVTLSLSGRAAAARERAVKGILDALKGCLYADDAQISLLEVTALRGAHQEPAQAFVRASAESEYRARFDAVRRALQDRDFHSWGLDNSSELPNPWGWSEEINEDWERLDDAREHLEWARTTPLLDDSDREALVRADTIFYEHLLRDRLLDVPFGPDDRPGPAATDALSDRVEINGHPLERLQPASFWLDPPIRGAGGSYTERVREAMAVARANTPTLDVLRGHPVLLDMAVDGGAAAEFDLDNLASKVLRGFQAGLDWQARDPWAYRIYRRETDQPGVLVRIRSFDAFRDLETAVTGHLFGLDFVPDRRD